MSINLNDEQFNESSAIFNNGVAGICNDVTVSIEKKGEGDKETAPEYKVVFTDSDGGIVNTPFWYITEPTEYDTVEKQIQKQGKVLKHLVQTIIGIEYKFPTFPNAEAMLDGIMKDLRKACKTAGKFRIFANYGTPTHSKQYIQPRSWVPFIEPMSIEIEKTRLKKGVYDMMERLEEENFVSNDAGSSTQETNSGGSNTMSDDEDDW